MRDTSGTPRPPRAPSTKKGGLADAGDRHIAMTAHGRSLLVEAGAGSGKTSLMAGRIALMLAGGIAPKHIAAVTFTELAASELLIRVRELVAKLVAGDIPTELALALPKGLSAAQHEHLAQAVSTLDDITCSTIHGFCQRLIKPYPVEAGIDPGAAVMDNNQADLSFWEITDAWLRQELAEHGGTVLAELVLQDPHQAVRLVETLLEHLRRHRTLIVDRGEDPTGLLEAFRNAVGHFQSFIASAGAPEPETDEILACFSQLSSELRETRPQLSEHLVRLLLASPPEALCTAEGKFRAYQKKGKWKAAAKRAGLSVIEGDSLAQSASEHYDACCEAWDALRETTATVALAHLVRQVSPVLDRFNSHKRRTAQLDFNDLIFAARDLLRDHEPVRLALAKRFSHVLVDEFQDTDPLQTEIFWRLCGDPPKKNGQDSKSAPAPDWTTFTIRPGALFLVGDPKQAIYRFRGADVAAYVQARELLKQQDANAVLSISTNFRSRASILAYVNERFRPKLAESEGQPGFTALHAHHPDRDDRPCVAALDIPFDEEKPSVDQLRQGEAEAVAALCAQLLASETFTGKDGESRACQAGDIALLAPTGADLWRYEEALERRGIAVSTQAGKGLFRRQEIQDLIALTRVLADSRDTLAVGALLRGPLVGLTEEELLDIVWQLPRNPEAPQDLPRLTLQSTEHVRHPVARKILDILSSLRRNARGTTPHDLLSQAIAELKVRPLLMQRHKDQAERALANVDLFLTLSRPYAVRGLAAFSEAMTAAWSDESRAVEGRPDAQEKAVSLYTMHASKGLEWPIVIPINTMTPITAAETAITTRKGTFHCPVFRMKPKGYAEAREEEKAELNRERIRLWYVATTRARELLVLPRLGVPTRKGTWTDLIELRDTLPAIDAMENPPSREAPIPEENPQTREIFAKEAGRIHDLKRTVQWLTPSREEEKDGELLQQETPEIGLASEADPAAAPQEAPAIQGGRERGIILHKLLEEILTGETADTPLALVARAEVLVKEMGKDDVKPEEVAASVQRALALPDVSELRPRLLAEFPVYSAISTHVEDQITAGIADAIAFDGNGNPEVVIDWKSDVAPDHDTLEHYRKQVGTYLDMTGATKGLIVLVTTGLVIPVTRTP